jgi:hypothetical protein
MTALGDSCRRRAHAETDATDPGCVETKSDLVVMPSGGRIFALFCSARVHKPQNSGRVYTSQSFHAGAPGDRHGVGGASPLR